MATVTPTRFYQPSLVTSNIEANSLGIEQVDPPAYGCPAPGIMCRHADVAFASWNTTQADIPSWGKIARTTYSGLDSGSREIDPIAPEFTVSAEQSDAVVNEDAEKVGRTTGWTAGLVNNTCLSMYVTKERNPVRRWNITCGGQVRAGVGSGDSGGPVFKQVGGSNVWLMGLVHGAVNFTDGTSDFVYSPMAAIRQDLPNNLVTHP